MSFLWGIFLVFFWSYIKSLIKLSILGVFPCVLSHQRCPYLQDLHCFARVLCTCVSDKQAANFPTATSSVAAVCMMTWGCLLWTREAECWHTLTKICLPSDVNEANTGGLVSKAIHKSGYVAPYLELMLDEVCVTPYVWGQYTLCL